MKNAFKLLLFLLGLLIILLLSHCNSSDLLDNIFSKVKNTSHREKVEDVKTPESYQSPELPVSPESPTDISEPIKERKHTIYIGDDHVAYIVYLPDKNLTPGKVEIGDSNKICGKNRKVPRNVRPGLKEDVYKKYDIPSHLQKSDYQIDHLVALELGGSNDITNLWPIKTNNHYHKTKLDNVLKTKVCREGISLTEAQKSVMDNWGEAYNSFVNSTNTYSKDITVDNSKSNVRNLPTTTPSGVTTNDNLNSNVIPLPLKLPSGAIIRRLRNDDYVQCNEIKEFKGCYKDAVWLSEKNWLNPRANANCESSLKKCS
ncbi:MAG: hypothetical protein F6J86_20870 [Symploca sp. SIO1B1]|nr:hypothetical protein [Symploca sp. SIO1B1]